MAENLHRHEAQPYKPATHLHAFTCAHFLTEAPVDKHERLLNDALLQGSTVFQGRKVFVYMQLLSVLTD